MSDAEKEELFVVAFGIEKLDNTQEKPTRQELPALIISCFLEPTDKNLANFIQSVLALSVVLFLLPSSFFLNQI